MNRCIPDITMYRIASLVPRPHPDFYLAAVEKNRDFGPVSEPVTGTSR